jgi:hypothetical protein
LLPASSAYSLAFERGISHLIGQRPAQAGSLADSGRKPPTIPELMSPTIPG